MRQIHITALVLSAAFLMAACSSPVKKETPPVENH
jgi:PBP1b-binding outer membrane lipoprotein LpoB